MNHQPPNRPAGFTLVEAIVVGIILAILAAVAVPMLTGYINDSRQQAVDELAQSAAAAASGFFRKTGTAPDSIDLNLFYDQSKFTVAVDSPNVIVGMIGHPAFSKTVPFK
jgi:type IV pilus assembly protein PilA